MATLVAAIRLKYLALTASNFPGGTRPAFAFDEMPQVNGSGAQLSAEDGYVVLKQDSSRAEPMAFGDVSNEVEEFTWEVYYPSLADCLSAAAAIRFNGGTAQQRAGFDRGTLPDLTAPPSLRDIVFVRQTRGKAGHGKTGQLVHCVKVTHRFCFTRSS